MSHKSGVGNFCTFVVSRDVRIHVDQTQKVETKWRRETTEKHSNEEQRIVVRLVVWRNEVNVEQLENVF